MSERPYDATEEDKLVLQTGPSNVPKMSGLLWLPVFVAITWLVTKDNKGPLKGTLNGMSIALLSVGALLAILLLLMRILLKKLPLSIVLTPRGFTVGGRFERPWSEFSAYKIIYRAGKAASLGLIVGRDRPLRSPANSRVNKSILRLRQEHGVDCALPLGSSDICAERIAAYVSRFLPEASSAMKVEGE